MGMPPFFSADRSSWEPEPTPSTPIKKTAPNPNPTRFEIRKCIEVNGWTIAWIHYPGCTTYDGVKLCVYDCKEATVREQAVLDPHFGQGEKLWPVARFEPTERGLKAALAMTSTPRW